MSPMHPNSILIQLCEKKSSSFQQTSRFLQLELTKKFMDLLRLDHVVKPMCVYQARLAKQPKGSLHIPILKRELEALEAARDEERTTFINERLKAIPR
jgi:hypothetical protein